eukprot:GILK01001905.1.p1 GENE.GILK01001905.1~~GILK01001905.1.p1  ORF type:complete len:280 (-),score=37.02 GILK01001905.1:117-956(-)
MSASSTPAPTGWQLSPKPQLSGITSIVQTFFEVAAAKLPPGPRFIKQSWVIDFQKGTTGIYVLFLMWYFQNYAMHNWVYFALHGTYGFLWILKGQTFPDPKWEGYITLTSAIFVNIGMVLGPYWFAAYLLVSGQGHIPSPQLQAIAIILHTVGVCLMFGADIQKFYTLQYRKGLISEGLFKYTRNPNYLGEMMLYSAYALLAGHWLPWFVYAYVWGLLFWNNMAVKDASLKRKDGWKEYSARSGFLLPKINGSSTVTYIVTAVILLYIYTVYSACPKAK